MTDLKSLSVLVAGAGVLGLAAAVRLARAGADVTLCDPAGVGDSASGVAAGMLAPAFETVLDPPAEGHLDLLLAARERWPAFLDATGAPMSLVDRSGALLVDDSAAELDRVAARLGELGLSHERLSGAEARARQPALAGTALGAVFSPDDWRIAPRPMLVMMAWALEGIGGRIVQAPLQPSGSGWRLGGEAAPDADLVVLATGAQGEAFTERAPELGRLQPVKGQILHFQDGPLEGPVLREGRSYVAPQPGGAIAGATMEAGRSDRAVDPEVAAELRARAARLVPTLADAPAEALAGVRAASPDGLPLVGRSAGDPKVLLVTGARRNGWLLAPLVAEMVLAMAADRDPGPFAAALDPRRFG